MHNLILTLILALAVRPTQADDKFEPWLKELSKEALSKNISQETLAASTPFLRLDDRVIKLRKKQPEFTQTLTNYLENLAFQFEYHF